MLLRFNAYRHETEKRMKTKQERKQEKGIASVLCNTRIDHNSVLRAQLRMTVAERATTHCFWQLKKWKVWGFRSTDGTITRSSLVIHRICTAYIVWTVTHQSSWSSAQCYALWDRANYTFLKIKNWFHTRPAAFCHYWLRKTLCNVCDSRRIDRHFLHWHCNHSQSIYSLAIVADIQQQPHVCIHTPYIRI